ncbi:putative oxygen-independent coproporphyrinogen III oxidase [Candidatus Magnetomorum sp. HK-1]|nr:putative oxygen-independent coproporphyrinogen III oxidase [Candidatus Magnetomorum sp. HK-1]
MKNTIQRAIERYNQLNIDELLKEEILKRREEYAFIFTYPPPAILSNISEDHIFIDFNRNKVRKASIYVHVPFCTGKCTYCYFCKTNYKSSKFSIKSYLNLIKKEILLWQKYIDVTRLDIGSIHFGGGTPTCLEEYQLIDLIGYIKDIFDFKSGREITVESSPETLLKNDRKLDVLLDIGVNRLNIGIQSFNNDILKNIGRRHNDIQAKEAVLLAKERGFDNINIDLMYGLPGQTLKSWEKSLNIAGGLELESYSFYRLRKHPDGRYHDINNFPAEKDIVIMQLMISEKFLNMGYKQASYHKFAKKKNFVQKQIIQKRGIKDNELLSFGPSAYGYFNNTLFWNTRSLEEYKMFISKDRFPVWKGSILNKMEKISKSMVLGIHTPKGIDKLSFAKVFGVSPEHYFHDILVQLERLNLLQLTEENIKLTYRGIIFANDICSLFYSEIVKQKLAALGLKHGIFFNKFKY